MGFSLEVTARSGHALRRAGLEAVRQGIPAARALPLLQALAGRDAATLVLEGLPAWRWLCGWRPA
jgi:NADPH:quinone reductase-like Zn-dependent oxidoreductase